MNDKDITKLVTRLIEAVASKDDIQEVKVDVQGIKKDVGGIKEDMQEVKDDIKRIERKFGDKFKELNEKADTILEFAEHVDETVFEHEKKLKDIGKIPVIAHELRKN